MTVASYWDSYTKMTDDERERNRDCQRSHRDHWVVVARNANYSAFNGYHRTWSRYSALRCTYCGRCWRTAANYVRHLPDAREEAP